MTKEILASEFSKIFWFETQRLSDEEQYRYHLYNIYHYSNNFDIQRVKNALQLTVNSNYNLRSNFIYDGNDLKQIIHQNISANLIVCQAHTPEESQKYLHEAIVRPFNLESDPLYRFVIVENQFNATYSLLLNFHHIILDGTQFDVIVKEIESNYINPKSFNASDKADIVQLEHYLNWEREQINKADIQPVLDTLMKHPLSLTLPYHAPTSQKSITKSFILDEQSYQKLKKFSRETGFSIFNILKSAWATLLAKYTNQDEIIISYPFNTRKAPFKEIKGCFVNTLYAAYTIREETFKSTLDLVRQNINLMRDSKAYLISPMSLRRSLDISQVNVSISMISTRYQGPSLGTLIEQEEVVYPMSGSELVLYFDDNGQDLFLQFRMLDHVLSPTLVNNIGFHIENCLMSLIDNYESIPIANTNLLSQEEYNHVVHSNNQTDSIYSKDKTIHQLFEEQVIRTPNNIAVIYEEVALTYQQLNERANCLANYLKEVYHIVPDTLVALCLERSEHMLIAILAVLKAGGAYVPMEPSFPEERLQYLFEDTCAQLILTNEKFEQRLVNLTASMNHICSILPVDSEKTRSSLLSSPSTNPNTIMTSQNLAYVIYTSGTTGKPKGAMLNHTGIVNRIEWMQNEYLLNTTDVVLQKTPYTFDVSVWELFWANWYGGTIVFAQPESHKDSDYLSRIIEKERISIMHFVPSMLDIYLESLFLSKQALSSNLKYIFCSGEALTVDQVNKFESAKKINPEVKVVLHNLYGPTEASVDVTYYACLNSQDKIPIGKPIQNIKTYILDKSFTPVPNGVVGELYISGIGLARGYLNRPELTEERFIANPFAKDLDAPGYNRMYKTGDLVRWMPDGNIEYLGRNDSQIKLRGLRIELGEIESTLCKYNEVKQSVILVKDRNKGTQNDKYLAAYYLSATPIDEDNLRQHLSQFLPEYMIPSVFIHMDRFPLSNNGKLDRKALPEPMFTSAEENYVPPRTPLEEQLCSIWQDVFKIEKIGIRDNFFQLGGDSILSIRIVSEMKQLGFNISVRDIFQHNTIEHIVPIISKQNIKENASYQPFSLISSDKLKQRNDADMAQLEDMYPVCYLQAGMLLEGELTDDGSYHDVFCYTIQKPFNKKLFLSVWDQLITKHAMLRTSFAVDSNNGYIALQYKNGSSDKCFVLEDTRSIEAILNDEKLEKFNYSEPGLFRFLIAHQESTQFNLIFSFHHVIGDGWSIASLISEFVDLYVHENSLKVESTLPFYGEFVAQEKAGIENQEIQQFWYSYLNDYQYVKRDLRFNKEAELLHDVYTTTDILSKESSAQLVALAHELSISVDILFLSAYQFLLSTFFNNDDLIIGLVVNNRLEKTSGDQLFGLFLNTIPFRVKVDKNNIYQLIKKNYDEKIKLYQYKIYPYGKIKADLGLQDDVYQCAFNYIHFHVAENNYSDGSLQFTDRFEKTNIPLFLNVLRQNDQFEFSITGSAHFVDRQTVEKLVHYLHYYLSQISAGKEKLVNLMEEEYQHLVYDLNQTEGFYQKGKSLHQLFEEQVAKTPNNIALVFNEQMLSYQYLNEQSNKLARYVQEIYQNCTQTSVKADTLIPICVDRSLDMIIGILGILKAGAAYVPIDPVYPKERIQFILNDINAPLILTQSHLQEVLSDHFISLIELDKKIYDKNDGSNLDMKSSNSDLAYVIYTSGTTGNPKGVMVEHNSVVNTISGLQNIYPIDNQNKKISCFTSFVFDVSVSEIFSSLLRGGELHLFSEEVKRSPELLAEYINQKQLSFVYLPPAILSVLPKIDYPSVKCIIFAGEPCEKNVGLYWLTKHPLFNYYGPTETTIYATGKQVEQRNINEIGKPLQNLQAYILDKELSPVPTGVIAELYIGGVGLARGYFNRPDLTAERFINNPFGAGRLYKTGDLARILPDGHIEYIGRNDSQVKIRGFRIELGEVENGISKLDGIIQSCVLANEVNGAKELVCYYTSTDSDVNDRFLKQKLKEHLPDYMIPTYWKRMTNMPLTVNGKLDLKKLATLPLEQRKSEPQIENANQLQKDVLSLWQEVLAHDDISLDDNFFDVGGHSLKMIHLKVKLEEKLALAETSMATLFKYPTIRSYCDYLLGNSKTIPPIYNSFVKNSDETEEIAIIGISGAFSGSNSVEEYWENIVSGKECIEFLSMEQCEEMGIDPAIYNHEHYIPAAGHVADIDKFDPSFWGLSPKESGILDPQIRKFLEHSWTVLETAGYIKIRKQHNIGVFCGASPSYYMNKNILNSEDINLWEANSMQGNSYLATRTSYLLGLTGPAMNISTACSTSLVSIV